MRISPGLPRAPLGLPRGCAAGPPAPRVTRLSCHRGDRWEWHRNTARNTLWPSSECKRRQGPRLSLPRAKAVSLSPAPVCRPWSCHPDFTSVPCVVRVRTKGRLLAPASVSHVWGCTWARFQRCSLLLVPPRAFRAPPDGAGLGMPAPAERCVWRRDGARASRRRASAWPEEAEHAAPT